MQRILAITGKRAALRWLAVPVFLLFLSTLALAACPSLHHKLHPDSDNHNHQCAATAIAHGQIETHSHVVPVTVPQIWTTTKAFQPQSLPAIGSALLPPGRAPPIFA